MDREQTKQIQHFLMITNLITSSTVTRKTIVFLIMAVE